MFGFLKGFLGGGDRRDEVQSEVERQLGGVRPEQPSDGLAPSLAVASAQQIAAKLTELLDTDADPQTIAEVYASFERSYPSASLPGGAQLRMARLLDSVRCRLLAVEAYRKAIRDGVDDGATAAEARMSLARLLAQSPASGDEALRLLKQIQSEPVDRNLAADAARLEEQIHATLDEIYLPAAGGAGRKPPTGKCRILAQTGARFSIPDVSRLLSEQLGVSHLEAKLALARLPGLLAEGLAPEAAERLAHALQATGTPVVVVGEEDCPPLPNAEIALDARLGDGGVFRLEVPDGTVTVAPARLAHAQFGLLRSRKIQQGLSRAVLTRYGASITRAPDRKSSSCQRICDVYLFDPLRRIRLVEGKTSFVSVSPIRADAPQQTFQAFLKRILRDAESLPVNHTVDLLFSDGNFDPITYDSPQDFDNRAPWLFWLAFNGAAGG